MSLIRNISFDQRTDQVGVTTSRGFNIFDCSSGKVIYTCTLPKGGAEHISLLIDSNIVAVSGDGSSEGISKSTVILWEKNSHEIFKTIEHKTPVISIFFSSNVLIVVQIETISFYNTSNFSLTHSIPNISKKNCNIDVLQTISHSLISLPSNDGNSLLICDYHDPDHILYQINIPISKISFVSFDRSGNLIALAVDEGKIIQLWSLTSQKIIATFKRGMFGTEVTCIAFDTFSNYFLMTSKRGTMHVFSIPTPSEVKQQNNSIYRSKYSFEFQKDTNYICQFDVAGYIIIGITSTGFMKKIRLDVEKIQIIPVDEIKLDL